MKQVNIWAVVLAAGASTRMKRQKMLLPFKGKTLIETVISNIKPVLDNRILVVLGSNSVEIKDQISKLQVEICINDRYSEGMLSSVQCGLHSLPADAEAVMLFLGDQPQIPTEVSSLLIEEWKRSLKGILIPVTNGRKGHPVLIASKYFREIDKLDPGQGLRQLMSIYEKDVGFIECNRDEILRDIDTPEDYMNEINRET